MTNAMMDAELYSIIMKNLLLIIALYTGIFNCNTLHQLHDSVSAQLVLYMLADIYNISVTVSVQLSVHQC